MMRGPRFRPDLVIVLKSDEQMHDTGAGDGSDGLVLVGEIGRDRFRPPRKSRGDCGRQVGTAIASGEDLDEFVADRTTGTKDGNHSGSAFHR